MYLLIKLRLLIDEYFFLWIQSLNIGDLLMELLANLLAIFLVCFVAVFASGMAILYLLKIFLICF